jgi:hypothetical protein
MLALRASDVVLSAPSRARMTCEAHESLLVVRRWVGTEERVLLFNPGSSPVAAPFSFTHEDVLVASLPISHTRELPARSATIVRCA